MKGASWADQVVLSGGRRQCPLEGRDGMRHKAESVDTHGDFIRFFHPGGLGERQRAAASQQRVGGEYADAGQSQCGDGISRELCTVHGKLGRSGSHYGHRTSGAGCGLMEKHCMWRHQVLR